MSSSTAVTRAESRPSLLATYAVAIAATAVATLLRYALNPLLAGNLPFITFFLAVLVSAWYGGFGPAVVTVALGSLAASYFFIPPRGTLSIVGAANLFGLLIYLVVGLATAYLAHSQRREQLRAESSARQAHEALEKLQYEIELRKRAELRLRESEARFRAMANSAPVMIWMADLDGARTFVNEPWLEYTGGTLEEELGHDWGKRIHPAERGPVVAAYQEAFENQHSFTVEYRMRRHDGQYCWVLDRGTPRRAGDDTIEGFIGSVTDIDERKRDEQALEFLAQAGTTLSSSLDYETTLATVARLAVPHIADWCAIDLLTPKGLERVAVAHVDSDKLELARELGRRYPPDPNAPSGVGAVVRNGEPEVHWRITPAQVERVEPEGLREVIRSLGLRSSMVVPLRARGRVLGALSFASAESGRIFDESDLALADQLARRSAMAVDNANLYRDMNEKREQLRVTLASIGDAVIATDARGQVTFMNAVAESITGWPEGEATGQPIDTVFPLRNEKTDEVVESPVVRVLREGTIVGLANHTILITRSGRRLPIDDSGAPIRDAAGNIIGAVLVFRDVTSRREVQRQIEESLERTRDLYEISRRISAFRTPKQILETIAHSRYLKDIQQASILVFDHPWDDDRQPEWLELVARWQGEGRADPQGVRLRFDEHDLAPLFAREEPVVIRNVQTDPRLSDKTRELMASLDAYSLIVYPLVAAGQWYGALGILWSKPYSAEERTVRHVQGVADQVAAAIYNSRLLESEARARRTAEEANALKLKFLAMVSHELRTPLTSIQGFASTLLADDIDWDVDSQRDFIRIISEEADKLTDLIGQLLDLSRLEAGMLAITPEPQPVERIIDTVLPQLAVLAAEHKLKLDVDAGLPPVSADETRIGQVLSNLVGNAARYAPPQTVINVRAQQEEGFVLFEVSDEGPGIPPEERETVFEAFQQASNRTGASKTKGAGLGLAIARGLIEAHGGRIWIKDGATPGTTVCFTLPVARQHEARPPA